MADDGDVDETFDALLDGADNHNEACIALSDGADSNESNALSDGGNTIETFHTPSFLHQLTFMDGSVK